MATLDLERGTVVIRVVYDGPPLTGKTTTLRALAKLLAERRRTEVFSPGEVAGRTLYFDWMEYVGGLMAGYPVTCQIVSVPGQEELMARRELLIATADVVVFVVDSAPESCQTARAHLENTRRALATIGGPSVGIVVQLNKRDLPEAIPLNEAKHALAVSGSTCILETVASSGGGIREAFVFAVRLALDRARQLMQSGALPHARPEVSSGAELLAALEIGEKVAQGTVATEVALDLAAFVPPPPRLGPALAGVATAESPTPVNGLEAKERGDDPPRLPREDTPSGLVWPPVLGRMALHQLEADPPRLRPSPGGGWEGENETGISLLSRQNERFDQLEAGRAALLHLARVHSLLRPHLSEGRSAALAPDGQGGWRLWTVLQPECSLRDALRELPGDPPAAVADLLLALGDHVEQAAQCFRSAMGPLPLSLDTVSAPGTEPRFLGVLPAAILYDAPPLSPPLPNPVRWLLGLPVGELAARGAFDPIAVAAALLAMGRSAPAKRRLCFELAALVDP